MNHPDCDEHLLAHKLRSATTFVPELDYVAVADGDSYSAKVEPKALKS
jgi:hypothetical protein